MPPVTTPDELTLATDVLLLLHVPVVTALLNVIFCPEQTDDAPDIIPGAEITVIVAVAGIPQPVEYVIVAVPALPPVTFPVEFTVATDVLLLLHVPPVTASVNAVDRPEHTENNPTIDTGAAMTVTVFVTSVPQPVE